MNPAAHTDAVAALLVRLTPRELVDVLAAWRARQAFCAEHAPAVDQALAELALALNIEDAARELAAMPRVEVVVDALVGRAWPGEATGRSTPHTMMCAPARLEDDDQGVVQGAVGALVTPKGDKLLAIAFRHDDTRDAWRTEGEHGWTRAIGETDVHLFHLPPCYEPPANLTALLHRTRDTGREQVYQPGVGHTSV